MRKTSQDGGDTSSITSGVENETKKSGGIMKTKRNSIKRKVQGLSHESDDAVIEPLLQKDSEKPGPSNQSAKYDLLSKTKTEATIEMGNDRERLLQADKAQISTLSDARNMDDTFIPMPSTSKLPKSTSGTAPLHNHMNTNVFSSHDAIKGLITTKSQILVEIDGSKQSGYNPSPLIFTTAKIHTDGKNKNMEPLQVTPVPILSTIEVSVLKGTSINTSTEKYGNIPKSNISIQDKVQTPKSTVSGIITTLPSKIIDSKALNTAEKQFGSTVMPVKEKRIVNNESIAMKDFNTVSKTAGNKLKDNVTTENNVSIEAKKEVKQTKSSLSQPISGPSSIDVKITTSGSSKPVTAAIGTKSSLITQTKKDSNTGELDHLKKINKIDNVNVAEQKPDINKNFTPVDARDPSHSKAFDMKANTNAKDKAAVSTMSASTKQLQRQKFAIDKDDPTTKLKSLDSTSVTDESKSITKSENSTLTTPKGNIQLKSLESDDGRLSDKTKLPISTANNIQKTSHITAATSTKPLVNNIVTISVNKSTMSKPIVTSYNSAVSLPKASVTTIADVTLPSTVTTSSISKLQSSTVTTGSDGKKANITSSNTQTSRIASSKPSTTLIPGTKTDNIPTTTIPYSPYSPSQLVSNVKPTAIQQDKKAAVNKSIPQAMVTKPTDINTKITTSSISTGKSTPASIYSTKITPSTVNSVKSPPATTSTAIIPPVITSTAKTAPEITNTIKRPPETTSTAKVPPVIINTAKSAVANTSTAKVPSTATATKTPSVATTTNTNVKSTPATTSATKLPPTITSTAKNTSAVANTVKSPSATSTTKGPPVSTNTIKSPTTTTVAAKSPPTSTSAPKSTSSVKTPAVTTSASKPSTTKINTIPTTKVGVVSTASSSTPAGAVSTVAVTTATTLNSSVTNKKPDAKSELSNGNKSLKA